MKSKFQKIIKVLFLVNITLIYGQEYTYNIEVFGKKIGTVVASRIQKDSQIIYQTSSLSSIYFFGKKEITTFIKTIYENNILQNSFYEVKKNGKVKEKSVLKYLKDKYYITIDNSEETYHDKPILMSTIMLTYHKPENNQKVFEEAAGFYKTMKKVSVNRFDLINPNSRYKDSYIYNKNGILERCIVRKTLFNFEMILKPKEKSR